MGKGDTCTLGGKICMGSCDTQRPLRAKRNTG